MKYFFAVVAMAGIAIGYLLYGPQPVVIYTGPRPGPAPEGIKRAHRYHGILASQWDTEIGEYVFYRDGQRCRLLAYLRKKKVGKGVNR